MEENRKPENPILNKGKYGGTTDYTLRDYFAAKAMQGVMASNPLVGGETWSEDDFELLSRSFYKLADAMLKEREK